MIILWLLLQRLEGLILAIRPHTPLRQKGNFALLCILGTGIILTPRFRALFAGPTVRVIVRIVLLGLKRA
jgi:hypothetical protein